MFAMVAINLIVVLASALVLVVLLMWGFALSDPAYRGRIKEHMVYGLAWLAFIGLEYWYWVKLFPETFVL